MKTIFTITYRGFYIRPLRIGAYGQTYYCEIENDAGERVGGTDYCASSSAAIESAKKKIREMQPRAVRTN